MKHIKRAFKLLSYLIVVTLISIGLGFSGVIFPIFKRDDDNEDKIEMVEKRKGDKD